MVTDDIYWTVSALMKWAQCEAEIERSLGYILTFLTVAKL